MHAKDIFDRYVAELTRDTEAWRDWATNALWTPRATRALVAAGLAAFPQGHPTAKGHRDVYGQSEYLCLDVCISAQESWGPPLFVAEHESRCWPLQVQFDAWKLLVVEAQRRVLVTYFGEKETAFPSFDALADAVEEVCRANSGKDVLLIGAPCMDVASNEELRALHTSRIIGCRG